MPLIPDKINNPEIIAKYGNTIEERLAIATYTKLYVTPIIAAAVQELKAVIAQEIDTIEQHELSQPDTNTPEKILAHLRKCLPKSVENIFVGGSK